MNPALILGIFAVVIAIATVIYVVTTSMKKWAEIVEKQMRENQTSVSTQDMDSMFQIVSAAPPSGRPLNPKIIALENELDGLYTKMEDMTLKLSERLKLSEKEDELVGQMTALFVQEGDRKIYGEMRDSLNSGSKS